jgi:ADP-heptose:LPS heptosyltransferase
MRKILVLRGGALGDFIVTLPALALLRQRWPECVIELVGNVAAAQLALGRGVLNTVHSHDDARWNPLYGDLPLPVELRTWLEQFDLVLSYWPDTAQELRRRFPLRPEQRFLSAAPHPAQAPAAAHYCAPLRELGLETEDFVHRLLPLSRNPDDDDLPPVAIHPGSGSRQKNWPISRWRQLVEGTLGRATFILGEAELERSRELLPPRAPWVSLVRPGLEELVTYFSRCALFLGHDSGISHLAAGCGVKCVLLFGPTEPALWAPPAPNVRVIRRGPDLASIAVEDVERAVAEALADQI